MNRGGANLNSLGITLKKCRWFEKIIKISGPYDKKHCVKKYENMSIIVAATGESPEKCLKKMPENSSTYLPHLVFWYCSNLPQGLRHFFISVQTHSSGCATYFFFHRKKKLPFSCNLCYLGPVCKTVRQGLFLT